jgi:PAS domain S-box-containing protein
VRPSAERFGALRRALVEPYGIAVIGVGLALALRAALLGPGRIRHLVGMFFVAGFRALTAADIVNAFVFVLVGVGASWRGELLRRSRVEAAASAQEALAREAHMKLILDTIPDAMIVIDERGIMQSFSAAAERLFDYSAGEVLGKNVKILMPTPYRKSHDAYLDRYKLTDERRIIGFRPGGGRRAQGRLDLPARAQRRRNEDRSATLLPNGAKPRTGQQISLKPQHDGRRPPDSSAHALGGCRELSHINAAGPEG